MTGAEDAVTSFCAALLPPESGGPDPRSLAASVSRHLAHAPRTTRAAVQAGFGAVALAGRLTTGRSLGSLPPRRRAAVLERVNGLGGDVTAALAGLTSLVLLAHGATMAITSVGDRARSLPVAHPDPPLSVTPSDWWPSRSRTDAVVIGSGAGGATAARALARAGFDVVVVEEGRRWTVDEIRARHPLDRYAGMYREAGTTVALGRPSLLLPIGRGVGGTTLVNSGTCYRPPLEVQHRWATRYGLGLAEPERLAPYLDDVEEMLGVAPVEHDVMGRNGQLLLQGAAALGWSAGPILRNAAGCVGSAQCAVGCPRNAKAGVHQNALPDACAHGARILSDAEVTKVLHRRGRAVGVAARRGDGSVMRIDAAVVVVAAGATQTPLLLQRSSLGKHPAVGRNLSVHPALGVSARFPDPVTAWRGVLQSAAVDELHHSDGILIEATSTPPGMGTMALPGFGDALLARLDEADHIATVGAMIADEPSGHVRRLAGRTVIRYDLGPRDAGRLRTAIVAISRLFFAAGASHVITGLPDVADLTSLSEVTDVVSDLDPRRMHLAAFHPSGTVAAGDDDQRSPVDPAGRLRGVRGVWVADASILPSCPEVNPQVSIMALASAVGAEIVTDASSGCAGRGRGSRLEP